MSRRDVGGRSDVFVDRTHAGGRGRTLPTGPPGPPVLISQSLAVALVVAVLFNAGLGCEPDAALPVLPAPPSAAQQASPLDVAGEFLQALLDRDPQRVEATLAPTGPLNVAWSRTAENPAARARLLARWDRLV